MEALLAALRREFKPLLRLALPLIAGELGWMTMGIVDTMMVGRLSKEAMGAVSVGGTLFYAVSLIGIGLLLGLDTVVSQAFGAGRIADCHRWLINGLWLALPLTPVLMLLSWGWIPVMRWAGVHPEVLREAEPYVSAIVWSTPPLLLYAAFRRYLQAMNLVRPVMFAMISANLVNVAANWLLIFGNWGFPALGTAGAAWATVISRIYMAALLVAAAFRHHGTGLTTASRQPEWMSIRELVRLGSPAAVQIVMEVGVFALATTLVAKLAPVSLAAHQIALSACSYSFMIPMGLGSAAAVRVGQLLGAEDKPGARRAGWTAIAIGVAFMGCAGILFVAAPGAIARIFTSDPMVVAASGTMLALAALFQLFDGAQGVATGALRGAGNTTVAAAAHGIGYWVVGLPVGWWLCFHAGWGATGLWVGLCLALILIGITLASAWLRITRHWAA